jgi:LPXTG-site transpeptidase (sortase) family protein
MKARRRLLWSVAVAALSLAGCGTPAMPIPPQLSTPNINVSPPTAPGTITPTGIEIPSIGVDAHEVIEVGLDSHHELGVPPLSKPKEVAWYKKSPIPGDVATCSYAAGCVQRTVLDGHINGDGIEGVFARLAQLHKGDEIDVNRSDGQTVVYKVSKVLIFEKSAFPTDEVYDGPAISTLALITCGPGQLHHGNYLQQTVVLANFSDFKPTT